MLPAWDLVTGSRPSSTAVLAALHDRGAVPAAARYVELALADVALAWVANMGWLSEAADRGVDRPRHGNHVYGSFGVDFACRCGARVMVVALTEAQWYALRDVTGTGEVFAALETAMGADLTRESDRYRLRETIAAVLRPLVRRPGPRRGQRRTRRRTGPLGPLHHDDRRGGRPSPRCP